MRLFFICGLLFTTYCISNEQLAPPEPPFKDLKDHSLFPSTPDLLLTQASTIDEIVLSLKNLYSQPKESLPPRALVEGLSEKLFYKLFESNDPEIIIMTVVAAASCHHPLSKDMCRLLLHSPYPVIQLAAVQALGTLSTHEADFILVDALRSDFPLIRLEAAWALAKKRSPNAFYHIDALFSKMPPELRPYIPEAYALEGSSLSVQRLKQLLMDPDESLVIETLLAIGRHSILSLSDSLVSFESHSPPLLEALCFSLRIVDSTQSRERLKKLVSHPNALVSTQAALSLIALGEREYLSLVESQAHQGNLCAVYSLGTVASSLFYVQQPKNADTPLSINQGLSRLMHKDKQCLEVVRSLLTIPSDTILSMAVSPGKSLCHVEMHTSSIYPSHIRPTLEESSLRLQESIVSQTLELDEQSFLEVASYIFQEGCFTLYPCLLELLANKQSDGVISLLQKESVRVGAPFNRAYATLGLIKLHQKEIEPEEILSILNLSREKNVQSWRFFLPWSEVNSNEDDRSLLQQTTMSARLYIEALSTLAESGSPQAISLLVSEASLTPKKYLPFVVSALMHASL